MVQPLDLHLVNVGSIPTGPTHGEGRLQPHSGDVLGIHPEGPEEPQIRLESGGEAERSPSCYAVVLQGLTGVGPLLLPGEVVYTGRTLPV